MKEKDISNNTVACYLEGMAAAFDAQQVQELHIHIYRQDDGYYSYEESVLNVKR